MCSIFSLVIQVTFMICLVSGYEEEDICYFKTQEQSECISLFYCDELKPLIQTSRSRLMDLNCGYEKEVPKVCCPTKSTTPKITRTTSMIAPITTTPRATTPRTATPGNTEAPDSRPSRCVTIDNKHGTCVPLPNCSHVVMMIMKGQTREFLRSRCVGENEGKVCCEESNWPNTKEKLCKVPNGDAGLCIQLSECRPLMDLHKKKYKSPQENNYLRQSYCGSSRSSKVKVCCPSESQWSKFEAKPVLYPTLVQSPAPVINKPVVQVTGRDPVPPATDSFYENLDNRNRITDEELNQNCGIDTSSANKIVGGTDVAIDQYPWMVLLEYANGGLYCGGSVISSQLVLTAAHCIDTINGRPVSVRLSEYNTSSYPTDYVEVDGDGIDNITVVIVPVNTIYIHQKFDRFKGIHDIAIIRLSKNVNINSDFIKAICLPTTNILPKLINTPTNFTVSGWGATANDTHSEVKQETWVPWAQCNKEQNDFQICAGGVEGIDSCKGDSGGPLMHLHNDRYYAVGITSYGPRKCGTKNHAATYTYVYKYMLWIMEVMNDKIKN